ncbi:MAG: hypothetical protein ACJAVI_003909 [Candidatus Azotimanducaceae bacterium]
MWFAENAGLNVHLGSFKLLESLGKFDLISTGMAFHWFESGDAIRVYKTVYKPGTIWLIYNFGFLGQFENGDFNNWLKSKYLVRYQAPPTNKFSAVIPRDDWAISMTRCSGRIYFEPRG